MASQTFTASASEWSPINLGLHLTLRNVFPMYFQVVDHAIHQDNSNFFVVTKPIVTDESDALWNDLLTDPRSEDVFLAFANAAREANEVDLWSLKDSGL